MHPDLEIMEHSNANQRAFEFKGPLFLWVASLTGARYRAMISIKMQKISPLLVLLILALLMVTVKNRAYSQTRSMEHAQERSIEQPMDEPVERRVVGSIEQPIDESVEEPAGDAIEQELAVPEDTEVKKSRKINIMPPAADGPGEVIDKQLEGTGLTFLPAIRGNAVPAEILEDQNKWPSSEPPDMGGP